MLTDTDIGAEAELDPPTYDEWWAPLAYDEAHQVLYLRTYDDLAWVRLDRSGERLKVLEADAIRPWLRRHNDGIGGSRMAEPHFSHALGRLFVSGYGGSWWPFRPHGFHSLEVVDGRVQEVPEADGRALTFVGDDPVEGAAVLTDDEGRRFHYDGTALRPAARPLTFWRNDPHSAGVLLLDPAGRPWRLVGGVLTDLDQDRVVAEPLLWLHQLPGSGRWVMISMEAWYLYEPADRVARLDLPPEVVPIWTWLMEPAPGLEEVLVGDASLWIERGDGATLIARLREGSIQGPADTGATADGSAFAFSTEAGEWLALRLRRDGETCSLPNGWSGQ